METNCKKFYFQELDWIICFPNAGNEGRKYICYLVNFIDRKIKRNKQAILADIVDNPMFEKGYPHTVGFFKGSVDKQGNFEADYLELRIVRCIEDFWKFLNDLNL